MGVIWANLEKFFDTFRFGLGVVAGGSFCRFSKSHNGLHFEKYRPPPDLSNYPANKLRGHLNPQDFYIFWVWAAARRSCWKHRFYVNLAWILLTPQCDMFKIWVGIWRNEKKLVVFAWNWVLNNRLYSLSLLYRRYIIYHLSVISLIWYLYIMSVITLVSSLLWLYHLASIMSLSSHYHFYNIVIISLSALPSLYHHSIITMSSIYHHYIIYLSSLYHHSTHISMIAISSSITPIISLLLLYNLYIIALSFPIIFPSLLYHFSIITLNHLYHHFIIPVSLYHFYNPSYHLPMIALSSLLPLNHISIISLSSFYHQLYHVSIITCTLER